MFHNFDETDILFVVVAPRHRRPPTTRDGDAACCMDRPPSTRDGENWSTVAARMALHNMLRRTVDLDRKLQVCGDVTLSFCHDFLRSDSDVIVYVYIWSLVRLWTPHVPVQDALREGI